VSGIVSFSDSMRVELFESVVTSALQRRNRADRAAVLAGLRVTSTMSRQAEAIVRLHPGACNEMAEVSGDRHSTVTLFARFRGLSTSVPRAHAV
jgi:hypothetical protein